MTNPMMPECSVLPESVERYVSGDMADDEQALFEEHFFSCDACLARVQGLQALQHALPATATAPAAPGRSWARSRWLVTAAASLLVGVTLWQTQRLIAPLPAPVSSEAPRAAVIPVTPPPDPLSQPGPPVQPELERMAAIAAPRYVSLPTRSAEDADATAFRAAMSRYGAGQYDEAAKDLRAVTTRSPALAHAQFFLGISELMAGRIVPARAALQKASASAERPYADEAHFYLAKAALREGHAADAERELKIALARDAGPRGEAARLLKQLQSLPVR
ncbi:MAG: tetratricopeptide repeat protein [Acidobacteriota bacterium]